MLTAIPGARPLLKLGGDIDGVDLQNLAEEVNGGTRGNPAGYSVVVDMAPGKECKRFGARALGKVHHLLKRGSWGVRR